jgi:WD40 repeat protein
MLWSGDALLDYTRWRERHPGPLTDLETAFGRASIEASARGRRVRRAIVAAAFAVLAAGILVLLSINTSKEAALRSAEASDAARRDQVIALDEEHGRQLYLAGDPIRAAIYLDAAVRAGGRSEGLRYLLSRAIAILDKQRAVLVGHGGGVGDGRYSPDGALIVTAGEDRTARVWDAVTGRLVATLEGHDGGRISTVDVDPGGTRIVTASNDKTARIWDARSGRELVVLRGHDDWVWFARFSPDAARIVTGSLDGTARLWDAASGQLIQVLRGAGSQVVDGVFAGADLYLRSNAKTVTRWSAETGQPRGIIATHAAPVIAIAIDRNARIASASTDGDVQIHSPSGVLVATLAAQLALRRAAFSPDGTRLALAGAAEVQVWDIETGHRLATMRGHNGAVTSLGFTPDGSRLASSSDDGTVRLWDAATGQPLALVPSLDGVQWLAFSRDGSRIAIGGAGGASVWDTRNDARRAVLEVGEPVSSVALRADGGEVIACGNRGALRAWSTRDGEAILAVDTSVKCYATVTPDGTTAITGGEDGKVTTWEVSTGRPIRELAPAAAPNVYAIAVSPDGRRVATGHDDNDARIWDIASGALLNTLTGHTSPIFALSWSPDGARVATCSNDGTAKRWDATTGSLLDSLTLDSDCPGVAFDRAGHQLATATRQVAQVWRGRELTGSYEGQRGIVTSVMFGPPGLLVTTSRDTTIRIWDLATRQPLESLEHPGPVEEADVSADRTLLASRSGSRVYLWGLAPQVTLARARAIVDALPLTLQGAAIVPHKKPLTQSPVPN